MEVFWKRVKQWLWHIQRCLCVFLGRSLQAGVSLDLCYVACVCFEVSAFSVPRGAQVLPIQIFLVFTGSPHTPPTSKARICYRESWQMVYSDTRVLFVGFHFPLVSQNDFGGDTLWWSWRPCSHICSFLSGSLDLRGVKFLHSPAWFVIFLLFSRPRILVSTYIFLDALGQEIQSDLPQE